MCWGGAVLLGWVCRLCEEEEGGRTAGSVQGAGMGCPELIQVSQEKGVQWFLHHSSPVCGTHKKPQVLSE